MLRPKICSNGLSIFSLSGIVLHLSQHMKL
ncbi:hypothetical protein Golob_010097, partial [Gossypium lobatum]|nr:hypothetical protein [Gossypium lobatum]